MTPEKPSICYRINCRDLSTDINDDPCFDCPEADVFVGFVSVVGDD